MQEYSIADLRDDTSMATANPGPSRSSRPVGIDPPPRSADEDIALVAIV